MWVVADLIFGLEVAFILYICIIYIYIYIVLIRCLYMKVVLNKSSQEPPFRKSFANLSPPFAVP